MHNETQVLKVLDNLGDKSAAGGKSTPVSQQNQSTQVWGGRSSISLRGICLVVWTLQNCSGRKKEDEASDRVQMTHIWGSCLILNVSDSWGVMIVNLGVCQLGLMSVHLSVSWRFTAKLMKDCRVLHRYCTFVGNRYVSNRYLCLRYDLMPIENKLDHF